MEIHTDKVAFPAQVPTPLYEAKLIGTAENKGEQFDIFLGLDKSMVEKLKKLSLDPNDPELDANTSDRKRFGEGSYEEWYAKKRVPFALVHKTTGQLAALTWFGPKPLGRKSLKYLSKEDQEKESAQTEDTWHLISYRSYPPFRGTGIMKDFLRTTMETYLHYFPNARLWAGSSRSNPASIALSERLGLTIDESASDPEWVAMVKK
ncbi:GNAT family N-acetyltransferase [Candidatus Kaiserbacteria bacterium]|nr:GNAT family N-acetyltransferase [Candidatus Kaiserbacteria bacterium]